MFNAINNKYYLLQEPLCTKTLDFGHVINLIRGGNRALNHRTFTAFLNEGSIAYGDLLMHTDIRWMNRGKCLERFFALRNEIPLFLEDNIKLDTFAYCCKLCNPEFICDMAFLTDMTMHLNNLNIHLQGLAQIFLYAYMNPF